VFSGFLSSNLLAKFEKVGKGSTLQMNLCNLLMFRFHKILIRSNLNFKKSIPFKDLGYAAKRGKALTLLPRIDPFPLRLRKYLIYRFLNSLR
jgi:hypothetical protein